MDLEPYMDWIEENRESCYGIARAKGLKLPDCEDVFQDTLMKLISCDNYVERGKFDHFFSHSFKRVMLNLFRTKGRRIKTVSIDPTLEEPGEMDRISDQVYIPDKLIDGLSGNQPQAIRLHYFEGLSYSEVGERIGKSEKAVKSLMTRGGESLRERMEYRYDRAA
jgi:RNA polymerase sigma factor (sigma-70 family)